MWRQSDWPFHPNASSPQRCSITFLLHLCLFSPPPPSDTVWHNLDANEHQIIKTVTVGVFSCPPPKKKQQRARTRCALCVLSRPQSLQKTCFSPQLLKKARFTRRHWRICCARRDQPMLPRQTLILAGETRLLLACAWAVGRHAGTGSCRQTNVLLSDLECSIFIIRQFYSL